MPGLERHLSETGLARGTWRLTGDSSQKHSANQKTHAKTDVLRVLFSHWSRRIDCANLQVRPYETGVIPRISTNTIENA